MCKNLTTIIFTLLIIISGAGFSYSQEINGAGTENFYALGTEALNNGNYNHAIDYFEASIKANPDDIKSYNKLGIAYRIQNDDDKAISVYKKSLKIDPENYDAYHLLSVAYLYKGENFKSYNNADKYLSLHPADPEAYFGIANVYSVMKEYEKARINYNKAISLYGIGKEVEKSDAFANIGLSYYQEGEYKEAIKAFNSAIEYNPKNAIAFYYMGISYFNAKPKNLKLARQNISMAKSLGYVVPDYVIQNLGFKDLEKN